MLFYWCVKALTKVHVDVITTLTLIYLNVNIYIFISLYFRVWCVQIILCVLPSTKHMQNVFVSMNEATEYFTLGSCKLFFIIKRVRL